MASHYRLLIVTINQAFGCAHVCDYSAVLTALRNDAHDNFKAACMWHVKCARGCMLLHHACIVYHRQHADGAGQPEDAVALQMALEGWTLVVWT